MEKNKEAYRFQVELGTGDLYRFSMHHTYAGASGIFGVLISVGSLIICAVRFQVLDWTSRMALLIIGCLFTIVQPVMLYMKAKAQTIRNKNIQNILYYELTEEGIAVSQGEQTGSVKWSEVRRMVQTARAIYLYMSPVRAFIFPERQCEGRFEEICTYCKQQLEKHRNDEPPAVEEEEEETSDGSGD